jgi:hypothetical protein
MPSVPGPDQRLAIQISSVSSKLNGSAAQLGGITKVVIKKAFADMEGTIRQLFHDTQTVEIIVDRRWHERRGQQS